MRTLTRRIPPLAAAIAAAALLTGCGAGGKAQPAQDVDQARRQVDQDASLLASAFVSVHDATSTIARENFAVDLKQMRADVQRVHDDRNTTLAGDPNSLCGTTQTDTDENQVESDQVQVESDIVSLHSNLAALADEVSTLEARARTYRVDQAIVPNYPPTTVPPTKGRIAKQIDSAHLVAKKAGARIRAAKTKAAQLVEEAKRYAQQADAYCDGR